MGERMTAKIYALCDPRISDRVNRVRYVGLTCVKVSGRVAAHIREAVQGRRNLHKGRWIKQLLAESLEPECILLGECDDEFGPRMEALFHSALKASGAPLCNLATGERALLHHADESKERIRQAATNISDETRRKRSLSKMGWVPTDADRRKMSESAKARARTSLSDETKAKIGAANRGNKSRLGQPHSEATKDKIRRRHIGRKHRPETIAKMRGNRNNVKLTVSVAEEIRREVASGMTQQQIATARGLSLTTIGKVVRNKIWTSI